MKAKNTILMLVGLASASAMAQSRTESGATPSDAAMTSSISQLEKKTENGITYVCGGIGQNEQQEMKQAASKYDLMVTFAASNGAYVADVDVDIADARGNQMLSTTCDGPIMLVDLPKGGNYKIMAEAGGRTLTRNAEVRSGSGVDVVHMAWPAATVDMGLTPGATPGVESAGDSGATGMRDSAPEQRGAGSNAR
jgi:hypothetical protein